MIRVLQVIVGIVVVVIVGAVAYLSFADLARYRPKLEELVSNATGRAFAIDGAFELDVLPHPRIVAEDVTLANADWGSPMPMVSVGHFAVDVGLWSLIAGPIHVRSLVLRDVDVLVETSESGDSNLALGDGTPSESADPDPGDGGLPVIVDSAEIRNVTVTQRAPGSEDATIVLAAADVRTEDDNLVLEANGQLGERPFTINGRAGTVAALTSADGQPDATLEAVVGEVTVTGEVRATARNRYEITAEVTPLDRLGAELEVDGLPAAPLALAGTLTVEPDTYSFADVEITLLSASAEIDAVVERATGAFDGAEFAISVENLADLEPQLPALPVTLSGSAALTPESVRLDPLTLMLGDSDFNGSLEAGLTGTPDVVMRGQSKLLDLTPFAGETEPSGTPGEAPQAGAEEPGAPAEQPDAPAETGDDDADEPWVFGEEPLPFETLRTANVDAELRVDELRQGTLRIQDLEIAAKVDAGKGTVTTSFVAPDGGMAQADIVLDASEDIANFAVDVEAEDLRINVMSGDIDDPAQIPPVGFMVSLTSAGASQRELAAGANGRVVVTQGAGRMQNAAVKLFSGDILAQLFSALNPFAEQEEYSNWDCTVAAIDFDDGVGELTPMLAQGEKLTILGGGTIDLNTEQLNLEFNTKPRSGIGVTADMFVTPFVGLGGTLKSPSVGLNARGALLEGGAAIATGGVSLLVRGLLDRATGEADQCAPALEEVRAAVDGAESEVAEP
jgi:uncharacterized protein involved in outer membrane biogenesis